MENKKDTNLEYENKISSEEYSSKKDSAKRVSNFFDDDYPYNVPAKLSILKLEIKRQKLLQKYYQTDYHKSGKDKRKPDNENK